MTAPTQQELDQLADILFDSAVAESRRNLGLRTWRQVEALGATWQIPSGTLEKPRKGRMQVICLNPVMASLCGIRTVIIRWAQPKLFAVEVE